MTAMHGLESLLVHGLVVACALYSLNRLLPRALKLRLRAALARWLSARARRGSGLWQGWMASAATRLSAPVAASGCGGCDSCPTTPPQGDATQPAGSPQPVHWLPHRPR